MTGGKPKLGKGYRATIAAAREYAAKFGAEVEYDLAGGKHPQLIVSRGGRIARSGFPSTPRNDAYSHHAMRSVRSAIRQLNEQAEADAPEHPRDPLQGEVM